MKSILRVVFVLILILPAVLKAGGDIVGAGRLAELDAAFKLTPQQIQELRTSADARAAYMKWLSQMPQAEQTRVYEKVFKLAIMPQLK